MRAPLALKQTISILLGASCYKSIVSDKEKKEEAWARTNENVGIEINVWMSQQLC